MPSTQLEPALTVRRTAEGKEFIALVTALMATSALGIDLMLPAFGDIRAEFGMRPDSTSVTWIVTAYFLGMAIGPWLYGPASDRFGRRRPLLAGLTLYAVSAALAAVAPTWPLVVVARFLWGVGASGPRTLSVAIIRDRYDGDAMAHLMSVIMAVFLLVPIVAPSAGAGLIAVLPWQAVFVFPCAVAVGLMVWARRLPETLPAELRRPLTRRAVAQAAKEVVTHRQTLTLILGMTMLFGILSTYLGASEGIVKNTYDLEAWFPLFFGAIGVVLAISSLNNARLVRRIGVQRLVRRMSIVGVGAAVCLVALAVATGGKPNFLLFSAVLSVVLALGQGLSPNSNALAMAPVPHVAGTASSIIATVTSGGGAVLGGLAASFGSTSVTPFSVALLAYFAVATTLILWGTAGRSAG